MEDLRVFLMLKSLIPKYLKTYVKCNRLAGLVSFLNLEMPVGKTNGPMTQQAHRKWCVSGVPYLSGLGGGVHLRRRGAEQNWRSRRKTGLKRNTRASFNHKSNPERSWVEMHRYWISQPIPITDYSERYLPIPIVKKYPNKCCNLNIGM